MNETFPASPHEERLPVPTVEQVQDIIEGFVGGNAFTEIDRFSDEQGLYHLRLEAVGTDGEKVMYVYTRANDIPGYRSPETVIEVTYFDGNDVVGSDVLFRHKEGKFINVANRENAFSNEVKDFITGLGYEVTYCDAKWLGVTNGEYRIFLMVPQEGGKIPKSTVTVKKEDVSYVCILEDGVLSHNSMLNIPQPTEEMLHEIQKIVDGLQVVVAEKKDSV